MKYKAIIFDADGMVNINKRFSDRYVLDYVVDSSLLTPFFKNEFTQCARGTADLKEKLSGYLQQWKWKGTVDELMEYWFDGENNPDQQMVEHISILRAMGIKCYLATNQEKYRLKYMNKEMEFGKVFDTIFSSCEIGYLKPETEFFAHVFGSISKTGSIEKNHIVFFDNEVDHVEAARDFGFDAEVYTSFENFKQTIGKV